MKEKLSVILLGHRTHLNGKPGGENSMSETAGCRETAYRHAGLGPVGMVKAILPEPQCPTSKCSCPDTAERNTFLMIVVRIGRGLKTSPGKSDIAESSRKAIRSFSRTSILKDRWKRRGSPRATDYTL
jgi:hypothetical protein